MKYIFIPLIFISFIFGSAYAQRTVRGTLIDSTKQSLPGSTVKVVTDLGDSTTVTTDIDGKFSLSNIKGTKLSLYLSSFGYKAVLKPFTLPNDNMSLNIPPIVLKSDTRQLKEVVIHGVN